MRYVLDALWRAGFYCLSPRVVWLSLWPLLLMVCSFTALGYFLWDGAVAGVDRWLQEASLLAMVWRWLEGVGLPNLKSALAPLVVVFAVTPLVVGAAVLAVSVCMTPALVRMVVARRFPDLQRKNGAGVWASVGWSVGSLVLAFLALVLTLPMWLVPPLALLLPALIWGWLTQRIMAFDALAEFANAHERRSLMAEHRASLLLMGVVTGMMGAAPSLVWASGAMFAVWFAFLIPVAIWIYMLVFAFASLWFTHFCLAALHRLRTQQASAHQAAMAAAAADRGEVLDVLATPVPDAPLTLPAQALPEPAPRAAPELPAP